MDQGRVAEFDTVLNLFDREDSIFRSLCDEANLQRADILRIEASMRSSLVLESVYYYIIVIEHPRGLVI